MNATPHVTATGGHERLRVRVRGVVQGVGFRPFVFGLARRYDLDGWVRNDDAGVLLEIEGPAPNTARFLASLEQEVPPLGRIDAVEVERDAPRAPCSGRRASFRIESSAHHASTSTRIGADAAPCRACLAEMLDPGDRRYRYPFLNCTHCGPRYSIAERLPYDRAQTSMARFPMCPACAREYDDPLDRRFHAQPTACPACGPQLSMPIEEIAARLTRGQAVAIKALGGFQIACDARDASAIARLRRAKERAGKPFAVMVLNGISAQAIVELSAFEEALLESVRRPIVLARRRERSDLAPGVAPDLAWLGVMLPSSPLHYLLFHELAGRPDGLDWLDRPHPSVLVMTSANHRGEPLLVDDRQAQVELADISGEAVAGHDRAVVARCDDPVVRLVTPAAAVVVRRGRGFVPDGIPITRDHETSVLATGAHLKNAICITRGDRAFLSTHLGDMDNVATYRFFEETITRLRGLLEVAPALVAHDLHPDFLSTRYAEALGLPTIGVQHHHAHIAAVLAEHGRDAATLGLALDGVGLGTDGQAWGGELLWVDGARFARVGHLEALPMPGGDAAAREPWRMAAAALFRLGRGDEIERRWGERGAQIRSLLERDLRCPRTTGCGRWFDAAAALLGVRERSGYEGEAPMVLESLVRRPRVLEDAWRIEEEGACDVLHLLPLLDRLGTMSPAEGAEAFHGTLAAALVDLVTRQLQRQGARVVAIGGGCIVNAALTRALSDGLSARGVEVLLPKEAPPGDGGLALGQAWVALRRPSKLAAPASVGSKEGGS